jgi:hypothetical protein
MNIPFSVKQFFDIFGAYNNGIWPAQIVAYLLGMLVLWFAVRENKVSSRIISAILAIFWIWMGVFYHIMYFSRINPAAYIFGPLFIMQGMFFLGIGTIRGRLPIFFRKNIFTITGACFIFYALAVYPLLGLSFGHSYPNAPLFGVAPCPTTIFTFGILLWVRGSAPYLLLVIPFLWSLIGMSAAMYLRVPQDYGLAVAGIIGTVFILIQNSIAKKSAQQAAQGDNRQSL